VLTEEKEKQRRRRRWMGIIAVNTYKLNEEQHYGTGIASHRITSHHKSPLTGLESALCSQEEDGVEAELSELASSHHITSYQQERAREISRGRVVSPKTDSEGQAKRSRRGQLVGSKTRQARPRRS
jgi:hypothetical protein